MAKILLGKGEFTWDAVERRSDRYGTVRLTKGDDNVLLDPRFDELEGRKGVLFAEVTKPVKSPHMGDLARGFFPSLPDVGEIVMLGEGELFIEHRGRQAHEKAMHEFDDDVLMKKMIEAFKSMGVRGMMNVKGMNKLDEPEVYDLVGLKPDDGRTSDWLNPQAFYRLHLSHINLFFEEKK